MADNLTNLVPSARIGPSYEEFRVFGSNPSQDGSLNLYTEGLSAPYGVLNLFAVGGYYNQAGSLNLVCWNNSIVGSLNLITIGEGIQEGAYPASGSLNLYIERWPDAALNLYCSGAQLPTDDGQVTQLTTLTVMGSPYGDFTTNTRTTFASMNLAMPYTHGLGTNTLFLYCHGF